MIAEDGVAVISITIDNIGLPKGNINIVTKVLHYQILSLVM